MLLPILYFALILIVIIKSRLFDVSGISKIQLLAAYTLKTIVGIGLGWLYTYYYNPKDADTFHYFNDANILFSAVKEHPWHYLQMLFGINNNAPEIMSYFQQMDYWYSSWDNQLPNENHFIIRFNAFLMLFSQGNYWAHVVFFNLFSLIGIVYFVKIAKQLSIKNKRLFFWSLVLFPSILIWSSGVLKEPLILLSFSLMLYALIRINENIFAIARKHYFLLALGVWLLWQTKISILVVFAVAFTPYYMAKHTQKLKTYQSYLALLILLFLGTFTDYRHQFMQIVAEKQHQFFELAYKTQAGSSLYLPSLNAEQPLSFLKAIPYALFNVFIQPVPWKIEKLLYIPFIIENIIMWSLIVAAVYSFIKKRSDQPIDFLWVIIIYTIFYGLLIGLTTPVLGAVVRYKMAIMPIILTGIFMLVNFNRILSKK